MGLTIDCLFIRDCPGESFVSDQHTGFRTAGFMAGSSGWTTTPSFFCGGAPVVAAGEATAAGEAVAALPHPQMCCKPALLPVP
jgi:hypothetical protein